jgi:hypothetical protein
MSVNFEFSNVLEKIDEIELLIKDAKIIIKKPVCKEPIYEIYKKLLGICKFLLIEDNEKLVLKKIERDTSNRIHMYLGGLRSKHKYDKNYHTSFCRGIICLLPLAENCIRKLYYEIL